MEQQNAKSENDNTIQLILDKSEFLENILNNTILKKFVEMHNADFEYNKLLLKQEVVASDACFFTKKKYGLYIKNREGKKVEEYEIKGMIMKRSDFPAYSKEKIQELLDIILNSDQLDLNKINEFVTKTREEISKLCDEHSKLISGAASFTKKREEYKNNKVPYQIKAMDLWNEFEYDYFVTGTKGYIFNILGIDQKLAPTRVLNKLDKFGMKNSYIVIPAEEEKLPDYYILDKDAQMKFAWDDRVNEILEAIMPSYDTVDDILEELDI